MIFKEIASNGLSSNGTKFIITDTRLDTIIKLECKINVDQAGLLGNID